MANILSFTGFEGYALIPFPPDGNVKETFEFATDIVTTHDGSESRTRLRDFPRRALRYIIPTQFLNKQAFFKNVEQNLRGDWALPLWMEAQRLTSVSGSTITCDTQWPTFTVGCLALFFRSSDDWEIRQVTDVNADDIVVNSSVTMEACYLVPVHRARIDGDVTQVLTGDTTAYDFKFDLLGGRGADTDAVKDYSQRFGICFTAQWNFINIGGSMTPERKVILEALYRDNLVSILEYIRGLISAGCIVDLDLAFINGTITHYLYPSASVADIDEAILEVQTLAMSGSASHNNAATRIVDFFTTDSPNLGNGRKDFAFIMTKNYTADMDPAYAIMQDVTDQVSPFSGSASVDVIGLAFDYEIVDPLYDEELLKLDNDSATITITDVDTPRGALGKFRAVLVPYVGEWMDGYEILPEAIVEDGLKKTIIQKQDDIDFGGVFDWRTSWNNSRLMSSHGFFCRDRDESLYFRKFLMRCCGRFSSLYIPTFDNDIRVVSISTDGLTLTMKSDDYNTFSAGRTMLRVARANGRVYGTEITATNDLGANIELTLSREIADDYVSLCFMGLGRMDTDRIEINWIGLEVSEATINFVELMK